jgi:broad specificity phosphatase PhoE
LWTIVVVRHAETEWSASGRHTSRTDLPLSEAGISQARALKVALSGTSFDLVVASPMARCRETAALAGFGHPVIDPLLREWDYGDYEGMTTEEIRQSVPGWSIWDQGPAGGETLAEVAARMDEFLGKWFSSGTGVALVWGHGHALRVMAARHLCLDARLGKHLRLSSAHLGVLGHEHEWPALCSWDLPPQGLRALGLAGSSAKPA